VFCFHLAVEQIQVQITSTFPPGSPEYLFELRWGIYNRLRKKFRVLRFLQSFKLQENNFLQQSTYFINDFIHYQCNSMFVFQWSSVVLIRIKMVNYYLDRSRHSCRILVTFPRGPVLVRCVISKPSPPLPGDSIS